MIKLLILVLWVSSLEVILWQRNHHSWHLALCLPFAVCIDCLKIAAPAFCRSSFFPFYAISEQRCLQLIKNATVVVCAGAENNHLQSQNSGSCISSTVEYHHNSRGWIAVKRRRAVKWRRKPGRYCHPGGVNATIKQWTYHCVARKHGVNRAQTARGTDVT